ncbi:hypothetical protein B0J11DRAFT_552855 [Dendryphion nanum]|uniref:Rhodopsin domain-containing protein n=1 Tax=Dendryphion nanum TaxID=256645 RepID=A0A9P9DDB1_9PLEO|nr:hypothetical protein B0J11DRAFT_552855 [Dendryphion nanum]
MVQYPHQALCLAVISGTPVLAAFFVALRLYTRRKLNLRLGLDDWLIVIPLILSLALIGPSYRHVKMWNVGKHIWDVTQQEPESYDEFYAVLLSFNLLNIPILPLVKASIIFLLLRAGSVIEWLKKVLYVILAFTVVAAMVPWFMYIFICPPLTGNTWKPHTFGNLKCLDRPSMGAMLLWITCANLLTDILIFPIPFIIVRRMMSARMRSRLVVLLVFASGLAVTAIGAVKIWLTYNDRLYAKHENDWTYSIDYCINHVENNVAIIIANIPILRGLVTRWVFNFRTKATPVEREFRTDWNSSSNSSTFTRAALRKHRFTKKILPCIQEDFTSTLDRTARDEEDAGYPPKIAIPDDRKNRSYKSRKSRRSSPERSYASADSCEKGNMLETVRSIGSLGSAPTLVESRELEWTKSGDFGSPMSSPRRISSPPISPITPMAPCLLRNDDDEIYPYR